MKSMFVMSSLVLLTMSVLSGQILNADWSCFNPQPSDNTLRAISGTSAASIFAGGEGSTTVRYNGTSWSLLPSLFAT